MKLRINMVSKADAVKAQGVGSAYLEQVGLVKDIPDFDVSINSKKKDFDIYHFHSIQPSIKWQMKKGNINVVSIHFVPSRNDGSIKLPKFADKIFSRYVEDMYKKATELVVVNPTYIDELLKLGIDKERITYIPNYVSAKTFYKLDDESISKGRKKYNIPKNKFIVLGCGQIQTRKGIDDYIETAKKCPDMLFIWAGGFTFGQITDGYSKYKKIIKNPPENVRFLGIVDRNEMNILFNLCDVYFMPSLSELFPMTILEVANIGKCLLLRDLDLFKPILFDNYAYGNNSDEFATELNKIASNNEYSKDLKKKCLTISEIYKKENVTKLWRDYYLRIYNKYHS